LKTKAIMLGGLVIIPFCGNGQNINTVLSDWSVVTAGNLQAVNDIQGSAYVGGNVTVPGSFNVATGSSSLSKSTVSFAVAGNIQSGGNLQVDGGSVVAGGTINRTIILNSGGIAKQNDPAGLPASPVRAIASASKYWSTLSANSSVSVAANGQLDFNCQAGSSLAVFNLSAQQMFGSGYQGFALNPAAGTGDILINLEGANVNWNSGSFFSQFNTQKWNSRVLFNFYDATSVNLSGLLGGYVVAPKANVTAQNDIDGGIMAGNLTVESAVDLPGSGISAWSGDLPSVPTASVPEVPAWSWAAGLGAVGLTAVSLRRRQSWFRETGR
jgi:choice-of-anchor A domain-containing protein